MVDPSVARALATVAIVVRVSAAAGVQSETSAASASAQAASAMSAAWRSTALMGLARQAGPRGLGEGGVCSSPVRSWSRPARTVLGVAYGVADVLEFGRRAGA